MTAKHRFIFDPALPGFEIRVTDQSRESYKTHSHSEFSVGAVSRGTTLLSMDGKTYPVAAGSLVLIPPETAHSCNPQAGLPRSYLMFYLSGGWCRKLLRQLNPDQANPPFPCGLLHDQPGLYRRAFDLTDLLAGSGCALEKNEKILRFATDIFLCGRQAIPSLPAAPAEVIALVKNRLSEGLEENITLQQLADEADVNVYRLLRSFKKEVGLTPHAYRLNLRIEKARQLLRLGLPPAAVAAETGFTDQSHFHKTFKKIVAATPGQFQKNL